MGEPSENKIRSFTDLNGWQKAHQLVLAIYEYTRSFPREEIYGLTNQIRRAAVSISSNIAEGFGRNSAKEKLQFYAIALGSCLEVQNRLLISRDIHYITEKVFLELAHDVVDVHKLIRELMKSAESVSHIHHT